LYFQNFVHEAHVGMEVIIVRPKIVGGFPGLGEGVELKGMNGLRSPSGLAETNVGIEGPDIFCVMWEPGNPDVQAVFLRPCGVVARTGICVTRICSPRSARS
jgi:hypothetical protein